MIDFYKLKLDVYLIVLDLPCAKSINELPESSGIYFVEDIIDAHHDDHIPIIYIGKSVSIRRRWRSHKLTERLRKNEIQIFYLESEKCRNKDVDEAFFISLFCPKYNKTINAGINHLSLAKVEEYSL